MTKRKLKIILIDDSPTDREITGELLKSVEEFNIELEAAQTGMEGLEKIGKNRFDLIILDYKMPGMTGLDFMNKLKQKKIDIPVIMATGEGDTKIAVEVMRTGAYDYIAKEEAFRGGISLVLKRTLERYEEKKERQRLEAETREYASKLKKANEQLKKFDQLKNDFISTVSHELRTPLTVIRESISQILDGLLGETTKKQREFLSMGLRNIDRLSRIINNLLDISKIEAGKIVLNREKINIVDVANGVNSSFVPQAKAKGIKILTKFSNETIEVYADKDRIIQVFTNLVGNALKFTKQGHIEISVADMTEVVECGVYDTGQGIAQEDLPLIFNKFQQFGRIAGSGEKGTGLGLSIVKGIIELHQGKIWAESKVGQGSKFKFSLPKNDAKETKDK